MLENKVEEHTVETGETIVVDTLASVLARAMDTDTADRLDEAKLDITYFNKVEDWIKNRDARLPSRKGQGSSTTKSPNDMVYDAAPAAHEEQRPSPAQPTGVCAAYSSPASDPRQ